MVSTAILQEADFPPNAHAITEDLDSVSFAHIRKGNCKHTENAIRALLKAQGYSPQGFYAELIMLLEKGFAYCYGKGERSHYQQVMPSDNWRKGDTLSEKLPRCKDKETFKRRFDRIGLTDILRREHFHQCQIMLNFNEHLYYRLIDTRNHNLSRFYRNDQLVAAFIAEALLFYKNQKAEIRRRRIAEMIVVGNSEGVSHTKAEVVDMKMPKPLLTDVLNKKEARRHKGSSLALIHSPNGTTTNPTSERTEDIGDADFDPAELVGLKPPKQSRKANASKYRSGYSGAAIYEAWRSSVLAHDQTKLITASPTAKDLSIAADFGKRVQEFFPHLEASQFFTYLAKNWISALHSLRDQGAFGLAPHPVLPTLLKYSDFVLTWFKKATAVEKSPPHPTSHGKSTHQPQKTSASLSLGKQGASSRPEDKVATMEDILALEKELFSSK